MGKINFRKLKKQISRFEDNGKTGYIFSVTDEQLQKGMFGIKQIASKAIFMENVCLFIEEFDEYKEFRL